MFVEVVLLEALPVHIASVTSCDLLLAIQLLFCPYYTYNISVHSLHSVSLLMIQSLSETVISLLHLHSKEHNIGHR